MMDPDDKAEVQMDVDADRTDTDNEKDESTEELIALSQLRGETSILPSEPDLNTTEGVSEEQQNEEGEDTVRTLAECEDAPVDKVDQEKIKNNNSSMTSSPLDGNLLQNDEIKTEETGLVNNESTPVKQNVDIKSDLESDLDVEALNVEEDGEGNLRIIGRRSDADQPDSLETSPTDAGAQLDSDDPEFRLNPYDYVAKKKLKFKPFKNAGGQKKKSTAGWVKPVFPRGELNSDKILEPFQLGWSRELVIRTAALDDLPENKFRHGDVYYFAPDGKKLRSMPMIADHLQATNSSLTTENFTFLKRTIYKEPLEVVREAGSTGKRAGQKKRLEQHPSKSQSRPGQISPRTLAKKRFSLSPKKKYQKKMVAIRKSVDGFPTSPKGKSPQSPRGTLFSTLGLGPVSTARRTLLSPEKKSPVMSSILRTVSSTSTVNGASTVITVNSGTVSQVPPGALIMVKKNVARKKTGKPIVRKLEDTGEGPDAKRVKIEEPEQKFCGLSCPGLIGIPPSLHCAGCLCLFHAECVKFQRTPQQAVFYCQACIKSTGKSSMVTSVDTSSTNFVSVPVSKGHTPPNTLTSSMPPLRSMHQPSQPSPVFMLRPGQMPPLRAISQGNLQARTATAAVVSRPPTISSHVMNIQNIQAPASKPTVYVNMNKHLNRAQFTGQLLTLPSSVLNQVNANQPLSVQLKDKKLVIPPHCLIQTGDGLKVLLPPGTLSYQQMGQGSGIVAANVTAANVTAATTSTVYAPIQQHLINSVPASISPQQQKPAAIVNVVKETTPLTKVSTRGKTRKRLQPCYFQKLHAGFDCMLHIFKYLTVPELLVASKVCRTWREVASQSSLWRMVQLKGCQVSDWETAARQLNRFRTQRLDMRGLVHFEDKNRTWHQLTANLHNLQDVRYMDFGQCPSIVLHAVADKLTELKGLNAQFVTDSASVSASEEQMWTTNTKLNIGKFSSLKNLEVLKLRGVCGLVLPAFSFQGGLLELAVLTKLKSLSITTLKDVPDSEFEFLGALTNLEVLEIGDCSSWKSQAFSQLGKLEKVHTLRLENGGDIPDPGLGDALQKMTRLEHLELIRFTIAPSLASVLENMTQLKSLSIWPNTTQQAAKVNTCTLNMVSRMSFLQQLDWGVIADNSTVVLEDDSESRKKTDCIPFLPSEEGDNDMNTTVVDLLPEYVSINQILERLSVRLPESKIRVFKVPPPNK